MMCEIPARRLHISDTRRTHYAEDCILAIIETYFPPGRVIVFWHSVVNVVEEKRSENYVYVPVYDEDNAEGWLLQAIHESGLWTVEISPAGFNHDFEKLRDVGVNYQHGAYLLFTRCRDEATVLGTSVLAWQTEKLSHLPAWNPRARFLVVLRCDRAGNNTLKLTHVKQIFVELQRVMAYNVLVLVEISPQHLQCFTWFPYNKTARNCEEIRDVILLNTWVSKEDRGMFLQDKFLYPVKFPSDIGGCPLRVNTVIYPPYAFLLRGKSNFLQVGGLEPQIVKYLAHKMKASVEFRQNRYHEIEYDLLHNDSDIVIGNMKYEQDYSAEFEFTDSHFTETLMWYVSRALRHPQWIAVARVFAVSAWLLLFLAIILSALLMRYLSGSLPLTVPQDHTYRSILNCFSISCSVILGVSVPVMPLSNPLRVLFFFWIVFCMAINNVFQSHVTSLLVEPGFKHQMDSFEELTESRLNVFISDRVELYFYYTDIDERRIILYNDTNSLKQMAYEDKNSAIFSSSSVMSFRFGSTQNKYHALSENSLQLHNVMFVKKGWPFLKQINTVINRLVEGGIPNKIMRSIINPKSYGHRGAGVWNLVTEYSSLSTEQLQAAFLLLGAGLGLGLIAFVAERLPRQVSEPFRTLSLAQNSRRRFRPRRRKLLRL